MTEELLAQMMELIDIHRHTTAAAAGVKLRGQPLKVPRPDDMPRQEAAATNTQRIESLDDMAKIAAWFGKNK